MIREILQIGTYLETTQGSPRLSPATRVKSNQFLRCLDAMLQNIEALRDATQKEGLYRLVDPTQSLDHLSRLNHNWSVLVLQLGLVNYMPVAQTELLKSMYSLHWTDVQIQKVYGRVLENPDCDIRITPLVDGKYSLMKEDIVLRPPTFIDNTLHLKDLMDEVVNQQDLLNFDKVKERVCTCSANDSELGDHHDEDCDLYTPF